MKVAITLDLYHGDEPDDILLACEFLGEWGVPATLFIPSSLLETREYGAVLRRIPFCGHEVAGHTHLHDGHEMAALGAAAAPTCTSRSTPAASTRTPSGSAPSPSAPRQGASWAPPPSTGSPRWATA